MTALLHKSMTVAEFLAWAEQQPNEERFELVNGEPVAMAPERVLHAETKLEAAIALRAAIRRAGLECFAVPDGVTVPIDEHTAYEPDALVYCGEKLPRSAIAVQEPVIVVEVLSPSTRSVDTAAKFAGYFKLPSVRHYLIIDPDRRVLIHHARGSGDAILSRILSEGQLLLDPPGLHLRVEEMFAVL